MNRYLEGNFGPVADEVTAFDLPVTGAIPPDLDGVLLRNGPNPVRVDNPASYHWFVGDGMLHGIDLAGGRARSYRNRWVRTDAVADALGEARPDGQPDDISPIGSSRANTHVVAHAGRILALEEVHLPTEIGAELRTIGRYDFGGLLRSPMTAHPKFDPVTGEMVFFGYDIFGPPYLRYHVVDRSGALVKSEDITLGGPVMVHDFSITEHYVVWMDLPVVFDLDLAMQGLFPFAWQPDYGSRVGVMPRAGSDADVQWLDIENCYVFHPLNAYEEGDRIVVDVARHQEMFVSEQVGPGGGHPTLDRWTIDPDGGKVVEERLDDRNQEFPRLDDRRVGRSYRYGYTTMTGSDDVGFDLGGGLLKHDLVRGTTTAHGLGPGRVAGEAVFVAAGPDAAEDEGWVLSVAYDAGSDGSDLVILDATAFDAEPVATVRLPQRVPFGFHGSWVPRARWPGN